MHDLTYQRRAIVSGAMEAAELARGYGGPVAVMFEHGEEDDGTPACATVGPDGFWRNDANVSHAVGLAKAIGRAEGWTVWEDAGGSVYVGGKLDRGGRRLLPDAEAVRLAIAAGVRCDDDGRID